MLPAERADGINPPVYVCDRHIELVEKYTDLTHLNARVLNRLIDRIEVSQRGKDKDGCPTQMIVIYFRFIGKAELELMDMISPALIAG